MHREHLTYPSVLLFYLDDGTTYSLTIKMSNLGSAASTQQASSSLASSSGIGGANLQAAVASGPVSRGQSQQSLPAIQSGMQVYAASVSQGRIQTGQANIQSQGQPLSMQSIAARGGRFDDSLTQTLILPSVSKGVGVNIRVGTAKRAITKLR
ncbi:hypothetical protein EYC80_002475 [Monilinia laxa]|uniref:Uncharacterized protein n=1 Tax=Monilinia laxa TaxID=61186 RepID=A0A5N6K438_MONLA|nr:hypothetical protein EYC80_002475 [Monilinia laxa]